MCETTGKIGTGPTPVSERMYRTIPRTHAKVKPENAKKLTERIPVSHTLNLLRNGIILQKGHIIYTGNAKSQILTSKRKSRWNEWGIQTIGKPTAKEGEPSARSWRSEQRVPRQTIGGGNTIARGCGKVKSLRRASTQSVAFLCTATARQASGVNLLTRRTTTRVESPRRYVSGRRDRIAVTPEITETRQTGLFRATGKREHEVARGRKVPANRPKTRNFGFPRKYRDPKKPSSKIGRRVLPRAWGSLWPRKDSP